MDAGQAVVITIDADSSVAYDGDDALRMDGLWETFHVRVTDNCLFPWVKAPQGSGTGSLRVQANSLFEVRVAVPSRAAPRRYTVVTSLER